MLGGYININNRKKLATNINIHPRTSKIMTYIFNIIIYKTGRREGAISESSWYFEHNFHNEN